ncbi:hypothetical protein [Dethiobacter alkaliphilus]|uniref:Uncharacterized protein n=1 Tax=Dethiobacter alkaliphilus AHT 1 TaxID=555088 RepID=C0GHE1_DETAL|nr:hypothetical protein [Dethiobacter alkaliphilus]EEG77147.1 hypothetical protein DealDRAFT_1900 [Dethiobacter alkaliphilus AHT 1]
MKSKQNAATNRFPDADLLPKQRRLPSAMGEVLLALYFIPPLAEYFFLTPGEHLAVRILVYSLWLIPAIILCFYLGQRGTMIAALGISPFLIWYGRAYLAEPSDYYGVLAAFFASALIFAFFAGLLAEKLKRREETLQKTTATDPVSGMFNQRFFFAYPGAGNGQSPALQRTFIIGSAELK